MKCLIDIFLSIFYIVLHTLDLLTLMIIYNLSINSDISALALILFIHSSVKLKSIPFKKFDERLYFTQTFTDCKEKVSRYLLIYLISLMPETYADGYEYKIFLMFGSDLMVDWINHFFMVKMNNLKPDILKNLSNNIKNFCFAVRYLSISRDKILEIDSLKIFDLKDVNMLSKKLPDNSYKCGLKVNYVVFPYVVIVLIFLF